MKKDIAFFDFDGTVTTHDTLLEFIKFSKGTRSFYTGFVINGLYLLAYKFKIISNQAAKEQILSYFFRNMPTSEFETLCRNFIREKLPNLLRPGAIEQIQKYLASGTIVVVVSASPENWIKFWTEAMGISLIASKLAVDRGRITGLIDGKNCHGQEKVRRIREAYRLEDFQQIYAYGDTSGDRPMLALATVPFYKPFR